MWRRIVLVALALATAGAACGKDDKKKKDEPLPAVRLSIAAAPANVREGLPATFTVTAVDTSGATAAFDGAIGIAANGPFSPASVTMTDGAVDVAVTMQLGGDGFIRFTALGLASAQQYVLVRPPMPARIAGPDSFASVLDEGTTWDTAGAWGPDAVLLTGGAVRLYYSSSSGTAVPHIGLANSPDGLTFTRTGTPLVGPDAAASPCHVNGAQHPDVFGGDGAWVMIYEGRGASGSQLCRATSADGLTWTPDASPVLAASATADTVDNVGLQGPSVVDMGDGTYRMLYGGIGFGEFSDPGNGPEEIGGLVGATSPDGVTWTRVYGPQAGGAIQFGLSSFPPFTTEWQLYSVIDPEVERVGTAFHVWSSGFGYESVWRIGRFSSLDLFALGPHVDGDFEVGDVLGKGPTGDFDDEGALEPSLIVDGAGGHRVFYTGIHQADGMRRIGVASF